MDQKIARQSEEGCRHCRSKEKATYPDLGVQGKGWFPVLVAEAVD